MRKRYKASIIIVVVLFILLCGYLFRIDRFGFTSIHWTDFINYRNELYEAVIDSNGERIKAEEYDIDGKIGEVKYTLQGNVKNIHYKYRNFDASILIKGTPIYRMIGDDNRSNIAIYLDGFYFLYHAENMD